MWLFNLFSIKTIYTKLLKGIIQVLYSVILLKNTKVLRNYSFTYHIKMPCGNYKI